MRGTLPAIEDLNRTVARSSSIQFVSPHCHYQHLHHLHHMTQWLYLTFVVLVGVALLLLVSSSSLLLLLLKKKQKQMTRKHRIQEHTWRILLAIDHTPSPSFDLCDLPPHPPPNKTNLSIFKPSHLVLVFTIFIICACGCCCCCWCC